jgi:hypothetical protein
MKRVIIWNSGTQEIRKRVDGKFTKCRGDRGGEVMGLVWPDLECHSLISTRSLSFSDP